MSVKPSHPLPSGGGSYRLAADGSLEKAPPRKKPVKKTTSSKPTPKKEGA